MSNPKEELLRRIPSITDLLASPAAAGWLGRHPRGLVTDCLRGAVDELRRQILADEAGRCGPANVTADWLLHQAQALLDDKTRFHLHRAINATGIILHTGLGRSVLPPCVSQSMQEDLAGYVTLAVDPATNERSDRDRRVEYILQELTGAEAATVVNNNAAATVLALSALAAEKEAVVSRGQLIEIGGAFRLPEVMAQSRTKMVEVGTTNRTHLRDYAGAITENTAVLLRVHPSNFRVVGFTAEVGLKDLAELAHGRGVICMDDLGAGALVNLEDFGLPHEPTVGESIAAGADVVLFSADKLIGAAQGGIIVGRKALIDRIRKHPLARAMRVDKSCLMALERTLHLFRDPARLPAVHPLYRMISAAPAALKARAEELAKTIVAAGEGVEAVVTEGVGYLGSGSLPMHELPTYLVRVTAVGVKAQELARRLRTDEAAVFARVDQDAVLLDARTIFAEQVPMIAAAFSRAMNR